jgi:hypothetical protein
MGDPLGREDSAPVVAEAAGVTTVVRGPAGVALGGEGGVGGAGVGVDTDSKMAVWVRLGVGKVKGVGDAAPGSVQPARIPAESIKPAMSNENPLVILHLHAY